MTRAARAWRASAGFGTALAMAINLRTGRGMCRTEPQSLVSSCTMAASWLKVRSSGPPSSRTRSRRLAPVATCVIRAATSVAETKLTGLSPRPNTRIFPEITIPAPLSASVTPPRSRTSQRTTSTPPLAR